MIYLILIVLLNVLVFSIFKLFPKYGIDGLQAIVVNYWVCVVTGSVYMGDLPISTNSIQEPWIGWMVFMGFLFIIMFNLLAYSTKVAGITTTIIANKLSLIIPVIAFIILYNESIGALKIAGILLAIPGVVLTTTRGKEPDMKSNGLLLPLVIFIGSGALDTFVKYIEHYYLASSYQQASFTIHVFATAALLGSVYMGYRVLILKNKIKLRSILAGVILGVPNFFSIYLLVRLFNSKFLENSAIIPINNIAILILSTLVALAFFKESLTKFRLVGIILSILSILLIVLADFYGG